MSQKDSLFYFVTDKLLVLLQEHYPKKYNLYDHE
jgi:hypothetical protein